MKIFFDTCAIVDFICNRENAPYIDRILSDSEKRGWERYISVGSFYTLTYLIEIHLNETDTKKKKQESKNCERYYHQSYNISTSRN